MAGNLFWLSVAQMNRLPPLLPDKVRGVPRVDDLRVISGIVHVLSQAAAGRTRRRPTGSGRCSTTAGAAGLRRGIGSASSRPWPVRAARPRTFFSTARPSPPTARQAGEKGGGGARDWPFTGKAHHEDPRPRGWLVPPRLADAHRQAGPRLHRRRAAPALPAAECARRHRGQGIRAATRCARR